MKRQLTQKEQVDIVQAFTVDLVSMIDLAKQYNRTRQAIWKVLRKYGVDIKAYGKITVSCSCCNKTLTRSRNRIRNQKNHFCGYKCYYAFIEANQSGKYEYNRHQRRIGREKVSKHFELKEGYVVHHIDRNCWNNRLDNLMVFRNQGDHIRYHRGFESEPLWDGSLL